MEAEEEEEGAQHAEASATNGAAAAITATPSALQIPRASDQKDDVIVDDESEAFVDAPSEPEDDDDLSVHSHEDVEVNPKRIPAPRRSSTKSFVTASSIPNTADNDDENDEEVDDENKGTHNGTPSREEQGQAQASGLQVPTSQEEGGQKSLGKRPLSEATNLSAPASSIGGTSVDATSTSSLLLKTDVNKTQAPAVIDPKPPTKGILAKVKRKSEIRSSTSDQLDGGEPGGKELTRKKSTLRNLVKFDIPEDSKRATIHLKAKRAQMTVQRAGSKIRRQRIKDGIVVKMERMLVRVDAAAEVPDEFDENINQRVISRVKDKWREYMIVCRHNQKDNADFVLQFYQTRVSLG